MIRLIAIADHDYAGDVARWEKFVREIDSVGSPEVALQIRAHGLDGGAFADLAKHARDIARNTRLVLNGSAALAASLGYDGVHYPEHRIEASAPPGLARYAAVHSSEAAERAEAAGVSGILFSPVFTPTSKSGEGAGLGALARICETSPLAVYALGGVTEDRVGSCFAAGAAGIAVRGGLMDAKDSRWALGMLLAQ